MVLKMNEVRLTSYLGKHDEELNITWYHLGACDKLVTTTWYRNEVDKLGII
jgi:hypothetical protein